MTHDHLKKAKEQVLMANEPNTFRQSNMTTAATPNSFMVAMNQRHHQRPHKYKTQSDMAQKTSLRRPS